MGKTVELEYPDTVNRAELLTVLADIERHPERWDQSAWATLHPTKAFVPDKICGTSFCFAGNALVRQDLVPYFEPFAVTDALEEDEDVTANLAIPVSIAHKITKKMLNKGMDYAEACAAVGAWENTYDIEPTAARLLGLTSIQADTLFNGNNTLQDLRAYVAEYIQVDDDEQRKALVRDRY